AIALSALVHVLMLGKWLPQIQVRLPSLDEIEQAETSRPLAVQLALPAAPPPAPTPSHVQRPQSAPTLHAPPSVTARPRSPPPPGVWALNKRAQAARPPPPVTAPSVAPAPTSDLSSYIEAQQRARTASPAPSTPLFSPATGRAPSAPPVEDENARGERAIAANLGLNRAPTFGPDATKHGGGVIQIQRMGYSDAALLFFGLDN